MQAGHLVLSHVFKVSTASQPPIIKPSCLQLLFCSSLHKLSITSTGARKSLLNVFKDRNCHPRVIDDIWEEKDQPLVHVVPAFTPYYAPQAELLLQLMFQFCVAKNVECNVEVVSSKFDENYLRSVSEHFYEDEVLNLPSAPDVCSYLMPEEFKINA